MSHYMTGITRTNRRIAEAKSIRKRNRIVASILVLIGLVSVYSLTYNDIPYVEHSELKSECPGCHDPAKYKHSRMSDYFRRRHTPAPEVMATAVLSTTSPRLLAAVAVKGERNTPYWKRNHGYKNRHQGAWGISEADWGKVPKDPSKQAQKAEDILSELIGEKKSVIQALNQYGGHSDLINGAYAYDVLRELREVPK